MIPALLRDGLGRCLQGPARGSPRQARAVCLFALGRIGDFVLTLSVLRRLIREFGPDACTLVIPSPLEALAVREFPGVRCLTLPTEAASLFRHILPIWRRERQKFAGDRFEKLVCLSHQRSLYYEVALSWIDAARDIRLMPATYPSVPAHGLCTELLGHWRLTETVLEHPVPREEILPRFTSLHSTNDGRLLVFPLSRDATRNLPPETVIATLRIWCQRNYAPVILAGSPADLPDLKTLAAACPTQLGKVGIETPAGLEGMLAQVAAAGAVFAADSAPAHVAAALDKPSVVMTSQPFYGYAQPWTCSNRQQVFVHGTPAEQIAAALPTL